MKTWKSKLFGDNCMNLCGWVAAGLAVLGASLWFVFKAMNMEGFFTP
jgi:hypothetical protein